MGRRFDYSRDRGLFLQIGGWFAIDTELGYVRLGRRRRWFRRA